MGREAKRLRMVDTPLQIPEDVIIAEILSRLPVESLLKFKCVSKSWYFLISSKNFIKTHFEKSKKKRITTTVRKPCWRLEHYSMPSFLCGEQVNYALPPDHQVHNLEDLRFVGSCNGLICLWIDRKYFLLWNPSTRETKKLPDFHDGDKPVDYGFMKRYGFGFDETSLDYKVCANFCFVQISVTKVYSLKADSWAINRCLENEPSCRELISQLIQSSSVGFRGRYASGKLHWYAAWLTTGTLCIHSFDLKTEVWGSVKQPSNVEGGFFSSLDVLDGRLCIQYYYAKNRLDVWVCNQYGVQDSWFKCFTISYQSLPLQGPISTPLCTLPNGEVLLLNDCAFLIYNPKENRHWYPQIVGFGESGGFYEAALYVESLVSLIPDGKQERFVCRTRDQALPLTFPIFLSNLPQLGVRSLYRAIFKLWSANWKYVLTAVCK